MADLKRYYELMEQSRIASRAARVALDEAIALTEDGKAFAERRKTGEHLLQQSVALRSAALAVVRQARRD